jgi:hypothetical protein
MGVFNKTVITGNQADSEWKEKDYASGRDSLLLTQKQI